MNFKRKNISEILRLPYTNFNEIKIAPIEAHRICGPAVNNENIVEDTSIDTDISIPQLYEFVKTYDQIFKEKTFQRYFKLHI